MPFKILECRRKKQQKGIKCKSGDRIGEGKEKAIT
jgi:hypothetical protein